MIVRQKDCAIEIESLSCFSPRHIFENGQAFRFREEYPGVYTGVAHGKFLRVSESEGVIMLSPCSEEEFNQIWRHYFDLDRDYSRLFDRCDDEALAAGLRFGKGLRVLNQEPFETLISFIISANNNLGRIRGIIEKLCRLCGESFAYAGQTYYKFPAPEAIAACSPEELTGCGCGYRTPYVLDTARAVRDGFDLESLQNAPYEKAKQLLCTLPGVGPKVADCVLLFSLGKKDAFPADVWIKRVMKNRYGFSGSDKQLYEYAKNKFGEYAGIAQQYLFYGAREGEL